MLSPLISKIWINRFDLFYKIYFWILSYDHKQLSFCPSLLKSLIVLESNYHFQPYSEYFLTSQTSDQSEYADIMECRITMSFFGEFSDKSHRLNKNLTQCQSRNLFFPSTISQTQM